MCEGYATDLTWWTACRRPYLPSRGFSRGGSDGRPGPPYLRPRDRRRRRCRARRQDTGYLNAWLPGLYTWATQGTICMLLCGLTCCPVLPTSPHLSVAAVRCRHAQQPLPHPCRPYLPRVPLVRGACHPEDALMCATQAPERSPTLHCFPGAALASKPPSGSRTTLHPGNSFSHERPFDPPLPAPRLLNLPAV